MIIFYFLVGVDLVFFVIMATEAYTDHGRIMKMEVDYSATVDEKIPICQELCKVCIKYLITFCKFNLSAVCFNCFVCIGYKSFVVGIVNSTTIAIKT